MKRLFSITVALLTAMTISSTVHAADYSKHKVQLYAAGHCYTTISRPECSSNVVTDYVSYNPSISHRPNRPGDSSTTNGANVPVGATVTAKVNFLGTEQGFVMLKLGTATFECRVTAWEAGEVSFVVPDMGLSKSTAAELQVLRPTGTIVRSFGVNLVKKAELIVHDDSSVSPSEGHVADDRTAETDGLVMAQSNGGSKLVDAK